MGLIDTEGQGITPEALSRFERQQYEHAKRQAQKCENLHQIEAYAYAHLVRGFSEVTITGGGALEDGDINVLLDFGNTFNSDDLLKCPWPEVPTDKYHATHKLFRSPWIARAADALGYEHFQALVLLAVDVTRALVAEQASYCDEDLAFLGWHERVSLVHDEMQKRYPQFAKAFDSYAPDDYDHEYDWAAEESIKVTAAAAYAVNYVATLGPRVSNPSPTPRRQTGGSDSEDPASASDDHDSHVQTYLHYVKYPRLVCWTSALEVISAILPAAKTIQKHIYQIGNLRLELSDYPSDFTPDYSFNTLIHAALEVGYTAAPDALDSALQSIIGIHSHPLFQLYNRFEHNMLSVGDDPADGDEWSQKDLTARMRDLDPGNNIYRWCKMVAERCLSGWAKDQMYDDMVLSAWQDGYTQALKSFKPTSGSFRQYVYIWVRSKAKREALKKSKDYVGVEAICKEIEVIEYKLSRPLLTEGQRDTMSKELEFLKVALGRGFLIKANSSLDAPLSDDDGSDIPLDLVAVGDTGGELKIAQHKLVNHLISQLTLQAQEVVRAKYFEGLTHKEIADRMDIPFHRVSTILSAAKTRMAAAARCAGIDGEDDLL